mgnify:CR=1 FL=1
MTAYTDQLQAMFEYGQETERRKLAAMADPLPHPSEDKPLTEEELREKQRKQPGSSPRTPFPYQIAGGPSFDIGPESRKNRKIRAIRTLREGSTGGEQEAAGDALKKLQGPQLPRLPLAQLLLRQHIAGGPQNQLMVGSIPESYRREGIGNPFDTKMKEYNRNLPSDEKIRILHEARKLREA